MPASSSVISYVVFGWTQHTCCSALLDQLSLWIWEIMLTYDLTCVVLDFEQHLNPILLSSSLLAMTTWKDIANLLSLWAAQDDEHVEGAFKLSSVSDESCWGHEEAWQLCCLRANHKLSSTLHCPIGSCTSQVSWSPSLNFCMPIFAITEMNFAFWIAITKYCSKVKHRISSWSCPQRNFLQGVLFRFAVWCCKRELWLCFSYDRWVESLSKLVNTQREYLKNLTGWLRLSLFHFVEPQRNGSRSPDRSQLHCENASPVYGLCQQWQTSMDQVPDRVAIEAIAGFASVVHEMLRLQCEELRIKKKVEFLARELEKREVSLHSASMRDFSFRPPLLHSPPLKNSGDNNGYEQNADFTSRGGPEVNERRQRMETVRRRLEAELEAEQKAHIDTRAYTLNSLQTGLPCLFQAMVTFSNVEAEIYERLYTMGDSRSLARITK